LKRPRAETQQRQRLLTSQASDDLPQPTGIRQPYPKKLDLNILPPLIPFSSRNLRLNLNILPPLILFSGRSRNLRLNLNILPPLILFSGRNLRLNLNILPPLILFSGRNLRLDIFFLNLLLPQSTLSSSLLHLLDNKYLLLLIPFNNQLDQLLKTTLCFQYMTLMIWDFLDPIVST
jgi:hypothetical protein